MSGSTIREYISNATAQTIGRAFSMAASFAVFVLAARFLGPVQFGRYAYLMVFWGVLVTVAEFGTNSVLAKQLAQNRGHGAAYLGNFIMFRTALYMITILLALPAASYLRPDLFTYLVAGIAALPVLGSRFFEPLFQIYGRPWFSLWLSSGYSAAYLIFSLFVFFWKPALGNVIAAYIAANVFYLLLALFLVGKVVRPTFKPESAIFSSILRLAWPIGLSGILTLVQMRADTFMLAFMKGDVEVGLYNAAYKFLDMAVILAVMITNPLMPIFSRQAEEDREKLRENFVNILEIISFCIVPVAVITPFVSGPLLSLCYGHEFTKAAFALDIMAWIGVMTFCSMLNYTVLVALEVVKFQVWLTALSAAMNVGLNLLLIPDYGFTGSALATLLTELLLAGVSFLYVIKTVGNVFSYRKWSLALTANLLLLIFLVSDSFNDIIISVIFGSATYLFFLVYSGILPSALKISRKTLTG